MEVDASCGHGSQSTAHHGAGSPETRFSHHGLLVIRSAAQAPRSLSVEVLSSSPIQGAEIVRFPHPTAEDSMSSLRVGNLILS